MTRLDFFPRSVYLSGVGKRRLDVLLVERELVETRQRAQALILAGDVRVNGSIVVKAGTLIAEDAEIEVRAPLQYASRGGLKLAGALGAFRIDVRGKICADVGASTGGFTDCLLQRGAARVYAIDVGYGQLAWKLRSDPRVVTMDRINIRHLGSLPESVDLATVDVSFISLTLVLPSVKSLLQPRGEAIALIKPQFEAGREQVGKGGIVRDERVHRVVIEKIGRHVAGNGWRVRGLCRSPITGADGNAEFLIHLSIDRSLENIDLGNEIERVVLNTAMVEPKQELHFHHLPRHVGIMMDGNGRWAQQRGLSRLEGHRRGTQNVRRALDACSKFGIRIVTLYVFSTENWGRPREEIDGFFDLLGEVIDHETENFRAQGVRLVHSGSLNGVPARLADKVARAVEITRDNRDYVLNVAFNYGGRMEILRAAQQILQEGIRAEALSEDLFERYLYTAGMGDMDLVIRTGGDERLSNFFPWQAARGVFYTTPTFWPDFDEIELSKALAVYDRFLSARG
jgi:23S rRNA (cytidine1920-2'-O)/16S rRNA (cytidine1409-2'-O)-methyltransferase